MKLTTEQLEHIEKLLDKSYLLNSKDRVKLKYTAPGVYDVRNHERGKVEIVNYSVNHTENEIVEYLSKLVDEDPLKMTTLHTIKYGLGSGLKEHNDKSTATLVITLHSEVEEGGEFWLRGEHRTDFTQRGDYLFYNGGTDLHEVTEIKKGWRMVLVAWWHQNKENIGTLI